MQLVSRVSLAVFLFGFGIVAANVISTHVHPFRTFYNEIAVIWALLAAVFCRFSRHDLVVQPRLVFGLLALLLMMGLQLVSGMVYSYQVIFPSLYIALAILAIVFGASFADRSDEARYLCHGIALAHLSVAIVSVGMETIQVLGWDWRPFVMYMPTKGVASIRPFANIAQPNQLALLLCLGLIGIWWFRQQAKIHGALAFVLAALLMWGLALTQSRIAWLILPIVGIVACLGLIGKRREGFVPIVLLIALYASLVLNLPIISEWMGFSSGSVIERIGGRSERTVLVQQAIAMIQSHPWLGVGWFGFGPSQVDIGGNFSATIYAEHSHNLVLNFVAELGIPFATLFFGALIAWLWKVLVVRSMRQSAEVGLFIMFLIAIGIHSMVEFPLWYAFVLLPLMVLAGLVHRLRWSFEPAYLPAQALRRITIFAILSSAFVVFDFHRVVDGFAEFRNSKDFQSIDVKKIERPNFTLMPDYYSYFAVMRLIPVAGMSNSEIEFLERTSHRFGFVHVLSKLAEVYVLNGRPESAIATMKTLSRIHPFYYPEYYDYWQQLARQDARYAQVFETMPSKESID